MRLIPVALGLLGGALLFGIAGTAEWWNAWIFLAFSGMLGAFTWRAMGRWPGLTEERRTAAERAKHWDRPLVRLINLGLPAMLLVAALDVRFRVFPAVPVAVSIASLVGMTFASGITWRAVATNAFFSSHVRIQEDRGHHVVSEGPYRIVRHPGYAGSALYNLLIPLMLGSYAALAPACGVVALLVYRTSKEDRTLREELDGYAEYALRTRKRLVPGIW